VAALAAAAIAALVAAGPLSAAPKASPSAAKRVYVRDNFFSPKTARVAVRGRVTWAWKGDNPHNVTFRKVPDGASKRRGRTRTTGSFTRSFSKAGSYRYVCTIHEDLGMKGTVVAD
jgi:plastocyanin